MLMFGLETEYALTPFNNAGKPLDQPVRHLEPGVITNPAADLLGGYDLLRKGGSHAGQRRS